MKRLYKRRFILGESEPFNTPPPPSPPPTKTEVLLKKPRLLNGGYTLNMGNSLIQSAIYLFITIRTRQVHFISLIHQHQAYVHVHKTSWFCRWQCNFTKTNVICQWSKLQTAHAHIIMLPRPPKFCSRHRKFHNLILWPKKW